MEIQGLSGAQNVHSQHGALHRTTSSSLRSTVASLQQLISTDNEADRPLEPRGPQSDTNNNAGPKTAQFRLLGENGSEVAKQGSAYGCSVSEDTTLLGLHNVTNVAKENVFGSLLSSQDSHRAEWRFEESGEVTPMALPLFEGEAEAPRQRRLTALRQQREDCALKPTVGDAVGAPAANGSLGSRSQGTKAGQRSQELFVVFNTARADGSCPGGGEANGKEAECCGSMEAGGSSVALYEPADGLRGEHGFSLLTENAAVLGDHQTVENVVLTNKYGDRICGQICTDNSDGANQPDHGAAAQIVQVAEGREPAGPQDGSHPLSPSACTPAGDTFSGTITINNQSIIVTIENGVLTLAAPPEGYVNKEDDMVSLKEHLGMKDHEDIVLLNYDSGTKSIGKISTRTVASSSRPEEPRPALSVSDSELALVDDCSLSQLGTSLDSCSVGKQGAGVLCAVTEADLIALSPKAPSGVCDTEGLNSPSLIRSKKDGTVTFACPEPGCSATFDSRQKLKVHLLNHTEEPRPYQCKVEGCGWAFATSYKLKRHLQSHDKQRPHTCEFEGCGRRFTTVYNLKAHVKVHEQDDAFTCEVCNEKFRSATRLTNHQRVHFAPQRPHKCDFPGCEKTFITFSALFSHNRTHFRETGQFTCSYPGCDKTYDKACRLKIHMRSHTGERPFVCDAEGCGWSFTSMSKLLRHKRKHDDDRRFVCPEEGCGKSFTRAEHLKGHSITHLGTKPFQCHAEGCYAKFSARSSLYIHSKKHKQDGSALRTRCPMASCSKYFSSRSNLKSHMLKHHHLSPDALNQMETTPTLTPSSELLSSAPASVAGPGIAGAEQLSSLDLSSLFSTVPGGGALSTGIEVGIPVAGSGSGCSFTMDLSLVSSGILTIDPSSVGATLVTSTGTALAKSMDPLIMAAGTDLDHQHGLEGTVGVRPTQGTINLVDVQTVNPEALGTLTALTMQSAGAPGDLALHQPLGSSNGLGVESSACLAVASVPELLASPSKVAEAGAQGDAGYPLACVEVLGPQEGGKVLPSQFVFPSSSFSSQKDLELAVSPSSFLDSGGSARTDYRAIQLAKKKKQRASTATAGTSAPCHRKAKASKVGVATVPLAASGTRYSDGAVAAAGGLTLRDPVTGTQYVQIQLLQDDPASDGDLPFQLSSQHGSSDSQLTVDLPVNILQEPSVMTEEDNGSDNSQFTGSTINLQDLE